MVCVRDRGKCRREKASRGQGILAPSSKDKGDYRRHRNNKLHTEQLQTASSFGLMLLEKSESCQRRVRGAVPN